MAVQGIYEGPDSAPDPVSGKPLAPYVIAGDDLPAGLEAQAAGLMAQGYMPCGGVQVIPYGTPAGLPGVAIPQRMRFIQAFALPSPPPRLVLKAPPMDPAMTQAWKDNLKRLAEDFHDENHRPRILPLPLDQLTD